MNENDLPNEVSVDSNFKKNFNEVTILSKWVAMILFVALPFIGGWVGYTYAPEKLVTIELPTLEKELNSIQGNDINAVMETSPNKINMLSALKLVHEKYGYGSGPSYVGTSDGVLWFTKPHETEGCPMLSYLELESGNEVKTDLTACPTIDISLSYPFHVVLCPSQPDIAGESLCVTNLLSLEERKIVVAKDFTETVIVKCEESDLDPRCTIDINPWDGGLFARIYKSIPREPFAIYENTELLREENINLFKEFGLE